MKDPSFVFIVMSPFLKQFQILLTTYMTFKFKIIYSLLFFLEQFSEYFHIHNIYIILINFHNFHV